MRYTLLYSVVGLLIVLVALPFIRQDHTTGQVIVSILVAVVALMNIGGQYFSLKKHDQIWRDGNSL